MISELAGGSELKKKRPKKNIKKKSNCQSIMIFLIKNVAPLYFLGFL